MTEPTDGQELSVTEAVTALLSLVKNHGDELDRDALDALQQHIRSARGERDALRTREQAVRPVLDAAERFADFPVPRSTYDVERYAEATQAVRDSVADYRAAAGGSASAGDPAALASLCCDEINPATGYRCRRPPIHDAGLAKGDRFHVQIDKAGRTSAWTAEAGATEPAPDRERLAELIDFALFGTECGSFVEDTADLPVGELRRLVREQAVPAVLRALAGAGAPAEPTGDTERGTT